MDRSPPGSSVHGILQTRILEWLPCPPPGDLPDLGTEPSRTVYFVNSKTPFFSYIISEGGMHLILSMCVYVLSHTQLFTTPSSVAPPGSSVHVISQARKMEWVVIPCSRGSSQCRDQTWVYCLKADSLLSESNPHSTLIRDS